ncbi:MAG: ABC transporter substrate-binding protein, partial [Chloroflexota bacterium]
MDLGRLGRFTRTLAPFVLAITLATGCAPSAPAPTQAPAKPDPAPKAATSPGASPAAGAPAAKDAAAAKPAVKPSLQRVTMAVVPPRQENNSIRMLQQPDTWPMRPMYEYLIGLDPETGKAIPQLATEWALEPDNLSFRFKLRRGVPFHGGHGEFTAKDVVFTWQDVIKPDTFASNAPYWRGVLKDVEIVNDYEVIFRLTRPDGTFLDLISESESGFEIRSKAHADVAGDPSMQDKPLAGTGPYQFKERSQAQYLRYEKVPYQHWRATPDFPEFEFRFRTESSTRFAALQAGEVQLASLPEDLLQQAEGRGF